MTARGTWFSDTDNLVHVMHRYQYWSKACDERILFTLGQPYALDDGAPTCMRCIGKEPRA
jgi:hypothetical protein